MRARCASERRRWPSPALTSRGRHTRWTWPCGLHRKRSRTRVALDPVAAMAREPVPLKPDSPPAGVAELADAHGLGPCGVTRAGSSPALGTDLRKLADLRQFFRTEKRLVAD